MLAGLVVGSQCHPECVLAGRLSCTLLGVAALARRRHVGDDSVQRDSSPDLRGAWAEPSRQIQAVILLFMLRVGSSGSAYQHTEPGGYWSRRWWSSTS